MHLDQVRDIKATGAGETMRALSEKRPRGRPLEFDRNAALRAAMLVFWKKGYEGATLADLLEAMEISKPSLYAAFGDKENLLREAVRMYLELHAEDYTAALNLPTVREVAGAWLRLTGGVREEAGVPPGCLLVQGALVGSQASRVIQQELSTIRNEGTRQLEQRFQQAKRDGDLLGILDPGSLAHYLAALACGLAVQSSSGVSSEELNKVVDQVMAIWPD
jgi:AcrR family transcriptional regulator